MQNPGLRNPYPKTLFRSLFETRFQQCALFAVHSRLHVRVLDVSTDLSLMHNTSSKSHSCIATFVSDLFRAPRLHQPRLQYATSRESIRSSVFIVARNSTVRPHTNICRIVLYAFRLFSSRPFPYMAQTFAGPIFHSLQMWLMILKGSSALFSQCHRYRHHLWSHHISSSSSSTGLRRLHVPFRLVPLLSFSSFHSFLLTLI